MVRIYVCQIDMEDSVEQKDYSNTGIPIHNKWEPAMTSQGHLTTASLKQASKEYTGR